MPELANVVANAITKAELIDALRHFDDDERVFIMTPAKDYWNSKLAIPVEGVQRCDVAWSDYHQELKIVSDEDREDEDEATTNVPVINGEGFGW